MTALRRTLARLRRGQARPLRQTPEPTRVRVLRLYDWAREAA